MGSDGTGNQLYRQPVIQATSYTGSQFYRQRQHRHPLYRQRRPGPHGSKVFSRLSRTFYARYDPLSLKLTDSPSTSTQQARRTSTSAFNFWST